ncbi:Sporulation and spore germination [Anaerobranca californiensis DSM 14826]|jgi:spore germination protein GerM|uniref:Sporulation and spore germination n=1 Tax=Anaerobranca californiensis DSM 14826 TaxID=1120989 RepID=A0A1M6P4T6_9FIRM|nr:GerMN domain-containing protein [Anaerobranca californiensis]SHK02941.1 Sporulation and spore germination [Anaerobranca californiensis DSM 14826]
MLKLRKIYFPLSIVIISTFLLIWFVYNGSNDKIQHNSLVKIEPTPFSETITVNLYFPNKDNTKMIAEIRGIPLTNKLETSIIKELMAGPKSKGLIPTIPKEAQLISFEVVEGIAFINFSKEFQTKHPGGSAGELATLASIVYTLTELENIDKVQILVEGRRLETLAGHIYIMEPLTIKDVKY